MQNINFETLKSAVKGALRVYEQQNRLVLRRFTHCQEEFFDKTLNYVNKPEKAMASSSMSLDFVCDTQNLEFSAQTFVASKRTPCFFDVYCDGVLCGHFGYESLSDGQVDVKVNFNKGLKRIQIFMPNLFSAQITQFKIDNDAIFKPYESARKFAFFGDSITQGYVSEYPSNSYVNIVAREFDACVLNQAIGGAYFMAEDLDEKIAIYNPDTVFVAYGTNDWAHGYDIENNATAYFIKLKQIFANSKFVCITPIWRGETNTRKDAVIPFESVGDLIESVCKKVGGITVIRGEKLVSPIAEHFTSDLLHPNDKGFIEYGKNLICALREKNI